MGDLTVFKAKKTKKTLLFASFPDFGLVFRFFFGEVLGPNGQHTLLNEDEFHTWLAQRQPKPPTIKLNLLEAQSLKERLSNTPGLTQTALAKELGIDRTSLIRNLNLMRLAPEIQDYIKRLEPSTRECPLTKKRLGHLATIADPEDQRNKFKQLIESLKANYPDYTRIHNFFNGLTRQRAFDRVR